jgi:RND family efflux transporter MFP subunit
MSTLRTICSRVGGFALPLIAMTGCSSELPIAETPPPPVSVSQPVVKEIVDYDPYEGRIDAVQSLPIRARVRGHLVKVAFEDGQIVKEGDLLFEIDPRPFEAALDAAKAQEAAAEAALDLAKKEYARTSSLARTGAASREELDVWTGKQAVAAADKLKAQANVEQAKLDLNYSKITAPIAGRTSRALMKVGDLVNGAGSETQLTTITTIDPLYVYFDVDERHLLHYRELYRDKATKKEAGAEPSLKDLEIPFELALEGEKGYPHKGMLDFTDNHVNPSTGTIQVRGVVHDPKRLMSAGMRAKIRVPIGDPHKSLMITERAVGTDQGLKFVYVVNEQNVAERHDVELGRQSDGLQVINEGLKPEDWIVVNGIQRVRDSAKVEPNRIPMPAGPAEHSNQKPAS